MLDSVLHPATNGPDALALRAYTAHCRGELADAEADYRTALTLQPDAAVCWSNLALLLRARSRPDEAERAARTALMFAPDLADAHNGLGMAQHDANRLAEAENSFRGAIRLHAQHVSAWINLGLVRQKRGALTEAESCYREALRLGATYGQVGGNLGMVLLEQGRIGEAEAACRAALSERPGHAETLVNLAMVLLLTGRMEEGWRAYEARCALGPLLPGAICPDAALWTGDQAIAGRTILVRAEQGLGDTLQFCRYASLLAAAGADVVLEVQPPLVRLLTSLRGIARVVAQEPPLPRHDLHCRLMSLPYLFGTRLNSIPADRPYLWPDADACQAWGQRLSTLTGLRVGLVWGGGSRPDQPHADAIDRRRSMTLADMTLLADVPGCDFVSLQLGSKAEQARCPPSGLALHDFTGDLADFADTAALIANLDLVIAVDTAVAHLAGAIGRPVWLLNRFDTCWRWLLDRDDSPWYPGLRQFRQTVPNDWADVMGRVRRALDGMVAEGT